MKNTLQFQQTLTEFGPPINRSRLLLPQRHHPGDSKHGFPHLLRVAYAPVESVLQRGEGSSSGLAAPAGRSSWVGRARGGEGPGWLGESQRAAPWRCRLVHQGERCRCGSSPLAELQGFLFFQASTLPVKTLSTQLLHISSFTQVCCNK